jgi:hypothetical protein
VASERQPFVQVPMMNDEDFAFVNDENSNCEINFLVDMSHDGRKESRMCGKGNVKRDPPSELNTEY